MRVGYSRRASMNYSHPLPSLPSYYVTFTGLPVEIHLAVIDDLAWPDRLALKHSSSYFYGLVNNNVQQRVTWLLSLPPPRYGVQQLSRPGQHHSELRVDLTTDAKFCQSEVIQESLRQWRRHVVCQLNEDKQSLSSGPQRRCFCFQTLVTPKYRHRSCAVSMRVRALFTSVAFVGFALLLQRTGLLTMFATLALTLAQTGSKMVG